MSFCEGCLQEKKKESNFCQSCGCKLAEEKVTEVSEKRNKIVHFITRALEILFFLSIIALWILYTRNPDWEVNKAKEEFKRKNYQRAINYCEKALNLRSDNKEAHEVLLNIYLVLRDNKNAREELNILLKLGVPGNENYMTWGDGFHECKDYSSAAKCYEKVLETKPEELEILKKIAECYKNSWQKQKAGEIYLNIGNSYLETQKFEEAEKYFKYALELNNQNLHIREGLSICYIKKKDYPEAIKVLKEIKNKINDKNKLEDINKQLVECYLILGNQYISHNTDEATTYFKKALTLDKG
ncbi:MAG TPA: tetratricopeptide repeat protein, partial [Candidatus Eremiobacteraeota bacterium]|nr:tetratricopeptide repeat protein [Candidatus Eremiobacteraeota bacterium]